MSCHSYLEKDSVVNCDETWCKVRKYDHYKKCYIWVLVNKAQKTAIFFYENGSRGRDVLTDCIFRSIPVHFPAAY